MPEYAGYQKRESVDWLSLAKGVKVDIDQGLKAREERKAADEKLVTDVTSKLKTWESTQNKSFNEVVLGGLDKARTKALEWNKQLKSGEITRQEYQRRMSNLNDTFDAFSTTTKNFDNYVVGVNKRYQDGEASEFEMFSAQINSDLMNIGKKSMDIGDNGDFFVTDNVTGDVQNVRNYTNMNNIVANKVDVPGTVDKVVSKWDANIIQDVLSGGVTVTEKDARLNKEYYNKAKADLIGSIVNPNDPRGVVSILLDNSNLDYNLYYDNAGAQKIIDAAVRSKEMQIGKEMTAEEKSAFSEKYFKENMIQVVQDNDGNYQPVINDKMIKDAQSVVENQIEQQLNFEREKQRGFAPSGGGGGGTTYTEEKDAAKERERDQQYQRGYVATMNAFGIDPATDKRIKGKADFSGLDNKYQYRRTSKGVEIWKAGSLDAKGKETKKASYVGLATTPKGLAEYAVYGRSPDEAKTNYERGRTQYRSAKGSGGSAPSAPSAPKAPR